MCRVLVYSGHRVLLESLLYRPDSSLVKQTTDPQQLGMLNLGGFGVSAWDPDSPNPSTPWRYRSTTLPSYDDNLKNLAAKLEATCVLAHVRGIPDDIEDGEFGAHNLHPFQFNGFAWSMAHNGFLRGFHKFRHELMACLRDDVATHMRGTTDSEAIYALVMSELGAQRDVAGPEELIHALTRALRTLRRIRERHGVCESSSVNLFFTNGQDIVATRFAYDFGCYDTRLPASVPSTTTRYLSLWYTLGERFVEHGGTWCMTGDHNARHSLVIASEPLTLDRIGWTEVPEYSAMMVKREGADHIVDIVPLDV